MKYLCHWKIFHPRKIRGKEINFQNFFFYIRIFFKKLKIRNTRFIFISLNYTSAYISQNLKNLYTLYIRDESKLKI